MPVNFDRSLPMTPMPDTFRRQLRRLRYVNKSGETIPPFACMGMGNDESGRRGTPGVEMQWYALKPEEQFLASFQAGLNHHDIWFFNTETPCAKDRPGQGTIDWPCQALFKPVNASSRFPFGSSISSVAPEISEFANGSRCGPVDGKWWLEPRADGPFSSRGWDLTNPLGRDSDLKTIWVSPAFRVPSAWVGAAGIPAVFQTVSSGGFVYLGESSDSIFSWIDNTQAPEIDPNSDGVTAKGDGIYYFNWQGRLWSESASRGALLILQAFHETKTGTRTELPYKASRLQDIEYKYPDGDILTTQEQVSITGVVKLEANESLRIKNVSATAVTVSHCSFSAFLITPTITFAKTTF